jgi:hypothetical protein
MTRDQAEQIARKHFAGADCTRELQRAVDAIMESVAVEKEDWAKTAETWPHPASWLAVAMRAGLGAEQARARGNE